MTDHPCKGMTRAATLAFEAIAINQIPRCSKATLQKLIDCGLIVRQDKLLHFNDGLPPVRTEDYFVPVAIHYQWCVWGRERFRE
ncbi:MULTISPECIES: hypothetical protein [unclassified Bradyrhizobium]|uniref:hypothetical protein n=1 Tax=unclassified Bradyrhizobium TaxID=2631580 RepID=UPI001FFAD817|nr:MULTISPECIES: hypothetical protein [unclassified Bradyrhizobium]MCK1453654.1 hypothetical protein [Bradyrhizobium sp. 35]MCK1536185.1 hypothetical protein [Bradyrhizobium sp. 176]MCK1560575.1 hypothetical protein [Bradyrhizobium sp. 171]MCK1574557.1 hypothetical protein [Bradyrhizobium sp. 174]MCK1690232.1 hypothetical protein [Bradyrhizobium sp. 145]